MTRYVPSPTTISSLFFINITLFIPGERRKGGKGPAEGGGKLQPATFGAPKVLMMGNSDNRDRHVFQLILLHASFIY